MKSFKQLIFTFAAIIGLSIAISAQKHDDQKRPPPKDPPPVVNPGKEKPPKEKPRDDKPKKPGMAYFALVVKESDRV